MKNGGKIERATIGDFFPLRKAIKNHADTKNCLACKPDAAHKSMNICRFSKDVGIARHKYEIRSAQKVIS